MNTQGLGGSATTSTHTMSGTQLPTRREWAISLLLLCVMNVVTRLHHLLNASEIHSDAAIVGLQAIHILKGEWSPFLWGVEYQSSFDAFAMAAMFALFGSTPIAAMMTPLVGHMALTALVFAMIRRHTSRRIAWLSTLPLLITPRELEGVILYSPRQFAVLSIFGALFMLDTATLRAANEGQARSRTTYGIWFIAGWLATIALALDLFVLQFGAAIAVFGLLAFVQLFVRLRLWQPIVASAAGAAVGLIPFVLARLGGAPSLAQTALSTKFIGFNLPRMLRDALPSLMSMRSFRVTPDLYLDAVSEPALISVAKVLVGAAVFALPWLAIARVRRTTSEGAVPWQHRFAWTAWFGSLAATFAFLCSPAILDAWSSRYLAPVYWLLPFAIAAVATEIRFHTLAVVIGLFACSTAHSRMRAMPEHFANGLPQQARTSWPGEIDPLRAVLREQRVEALLGQYWIAYRLGFLLNDEWPVSAWAGDDRYPPYRAAWRAAKVRAYVFHPDETRLTAQAVKARMKQTNVPFEEMKVGRFTLLIERRDPTDK